MELKSWATYSIL